MADRDGVAGRGSIVEPLERVGPGRYRTTQPVPLHKPWKSLIRLHKGSALTIMPVYLPGDAAIPAKEVPAPARFTREFVSDGSILQREARGGSLWVKIPAYLVLLAIMGGEIAALTWGIRRLRLRTREDAEPPVTRHGPPVAAAEPRPLVTA